MVDFDGGENGSENVSQNECTAEADWAMGDS